MTKSQTKKKTPPRKKQPRHAGKQADLFMPIQRNARSVALMILTDVLHRKLQLDQIWPTHADYNALADSDRAFCRLLVMIILRHKGALERVITAHLDQSDPLPHSLMHILSIGAAELLILRKSPYAAVNSCVDLVELPLQKYRKLVNAIMRRISEYPHDITLDETNIIENLPSWLWQDWERDYGREKSLAMIRACLNEPATDICLKSGLDSTAWAEKLNATILPTGALRVQNPTGRIEDWYGFEEGAWWIQDAAASLPVALLDADFLAQKNVIDLCAAPGGKTMQLLDKGAIVTAVDRSAKRLLKLDENCARLGFHDQMQGRVIVADGANYTPKNKTDIVLIDAPCSATGTLRRHPELKYLKNPDDIDRLRVTQERLLDQAATMLNENGLLIYITCSLQKNEGEQQIHDFMNRHNGQFEIFLPEKARQSAFAPMISPEGFIRITPDIWSDIGGLDGFFCAYLRAI